MVSAVGRKKRTAARIQRLTEEVPLWAAAAIQRGPSTAAMLNNRTSQKPIARRSSGVVLAGSWFTRIPFRSSERGKIAELVLKNKKAPHNGTPFALQDRTECTIDEICETAGRYRRWPVQAGRAKVAG